MSNTEPETPMQTPSTSTSGGRADAANPFDRPSEDVVLRTSDETEFYVNKWVLRDISSFFADMFDVPQPTVTKAEDASSDIDLGPSISRLEGSTGDVEVSAPSSPPLPTVIPVTEDATTLGLLLKLCYPSVNLPTFPTFDSMKPVLAAAHKYDIEHVFDVLRPRLREISRKTPVRVFAFAARYGSRGDGSRMSALMQDAARDFLTLPDMWCYADELASIDAATYYRLIMYRNLCTSALQELRHTPLRAWFSGPPWFSQPQEWIWFSCCGQHPGKNWNHDCDQDCTAATWFQAHWARLCDVLGKTPHAEAIRDPKLADQVLQEAYRCEGCRTYKVSGSEQIRRFTNLFAADVEKRLSKISLDNIPCIALTGEPEVPPDEA
ncbi:hypothetical protein OH76DRAFT_1059743 [Lentinus brumalis]|uniref:BTB domain-containing protein n=1 Tax=Lentinus brumalis TaxID=2498619 RepID=A0A371DNG9_9APHY|nr:hypothetical protein OH76DRAFT_1059743 [Polyporus brumalis]